MCFLLHASRARGLGSQWVKTNRPVKKRAGKKLKVFFQEGSELRLGNGAHLSRFDVTVFK
jgi:hypothetical protein